MRTRLLRAGAAVFAPLGTAVMRRSRYRRILPPQPRPAVLAVGRFFVHEPSFSMAPVRCGFAEETKSPSPQMTGLVVLDRIEGPDANSINWSRRTAGPGPASGFGKPGSRGGAGDARAARNLLAGSGRAAYGEHRATVRN